MSRATLQNILQILEIAPQNPDAHFFACHQPVEEKMFWKRKSPHTPQPAPVSADNGSFQDIISDAERRGDRRTQLVFRLIQVADEAQKMQASMQFITDSYSDVLTDLTQNADQLLPGQLADDAQEIERLVIEAFEGINDLAERSADLVIKLSKAKVVPSA